MSLKVQAKPCASCIYRPDSLLDICTLEAQIADPRMEGHFKGFRACHHAQGATVCCRGFWDRHKDHFDGGQLAQRLGLVEFVDVDTWPHTPLNNTRRRSRLAPILRVTVLYTVGGVRRRSTREAEAANAAILTRAVKRDVRKRHPKAEFYEVRVQRKVEKGKRKRR